MTDGLTAPDFPAPARRGLCTDCGVSRLTGALDGGLTAKACGRACQFIAPDYPGAGACVHGRARDPDRADELHFGPFRRMLRARSEPPRPGAQWTGDHHAPRRTAAGDRRGRRRADWRARPRGPLAPAPVLVTEPAGMAGLRGMRMGYAPLLALLEPAAAQGHRRIAVIGIPCQVYALRALEAELGFERIYVIGTPCSDNTTTENFHTFLEPARRPARDDHLSGIPRRLPRRAALRRRARRPAFRS
jgi:coenzyme F420 hydrogenase subunit beta